MMNDDDKIDGVDIYEEYLWYRKFMTPREIVLAIREWRKKNGFQGWNDTAESDNRVYSGKSHLRVHFDGSPE